MRSLLSSMRMGWDLDGVLNHGDEAGLSWLKQQGLVEQSATVAQITSWYWEECFPGLTREDTDRMYREGEVFAQAAPDWEGRDMLIDLLRHGVEIHIVTNRAWDESTAHHRGITTEWLARFGIPYHRLAFSADKAGYARGHNLDLFVEDKLPSAIKLVDAVRVSFLRDKPYNQVDSATVEEVRRFYDWDELSRFFWPPR
jgi:uncharacterized HAD superfamily protein